jgi:glutamyl-tRNA reductase
LSWCYSLHRYPYLSFFSLVSLLMNLFCLGLNHETAPLEVREKFSIPMEHLGQRSYQLTTLDGVREAVVISTCNRMEVYVAAEDDKLSDAESSVKKNLGFEVNDTAHFYNCRSVEAMKHLCRVVSGLDSMVLGETEIFGQVKKAYQYALEATATGGVLNKVFQKSFGVGKKVRTETTIQNGQTSVGSVALDLAEKIFSDLKDSTVMVIGAGEMSRITVQSMVLRGVKKVYVTNRSHDKAVALANEVGGEAVRFNDWSKVLATVDVVISSTGSTEPVVRASDIEAVRKKRKYRPLFMIDIAVPRDIEHGVGEIEEVYLYDLDTLQKQVDEGHARRKAQVRECEKIIDAEVLKITNQQNNHV